MHFRLGNCMARNEQLPFLLLGILLLLHPAPAAAGAFNITKILADFPDFSVLNSLLVETGLAHAINTREAVTLLAPNNTAIIAAAAPRGAPRSFLVDLLALHVVLDYLDAPKLAALMQRGARSGADGGSVLTTLLQSVRAVPRGAGFIRVVAASAGAGGDRVVTFSSAAPGAGQRNATFERQVVAQPYNVSVLQVSGFVVPPGIKFVQPFPPPRARHMSAPPPSHAQGPAPAPGPQPPVSGSGPLVPSPVRPFPTPNLINSPPPLPEEETGVIPIPSVHGGMAAKLPSQSAAGHGTSNWWSGLSWALGITTSLLGLL